MADEVSNEVQNEGQEAPATISIKDIPEAELNAFLAKHKRTLQTELKQAKSEAKAYQTLKAQMDQILEGRPLDEFREEVEANLSSLRNEKEQAELKAAKQSKELERATKQAQEYQTRYERAQTTRAISDVAGPKAVSTGAAELINQLLSPRSKVLDDGSVLVTMEVMDEDLGKKIPKDVTPAEAVAILESDVTNYGTLFKTTAHSGNGTSVDGLKRTPEGTVDIQKLSFKEFRELEKNNPEALLAALGQK